MNSERGATRASELFKIMRLRLEMHRDGLTHPRDGVVRATEDLVNALMQCGPDDVVWIDIHPCPGVVGRYVLASTGAVLAEVPA